MTFALKWIGGIAAMAVGTTGVVLSVLAVVQAWQTADRLSRGLPKEMAHLERIAESVQQQGAATLVLLGTARKQVDAIGEVVVDLSNKPERGQAVSILDTLDEEIGQRLDDAEEFVRSMQSSMRSLSNMLLVFESFPWLRSPGSSEELPVRRGNSAAASLVETAELLDQVARMITRVRAGQTLTPGQLSQVQASLERLDRHIGEVQSQVRQFSRRTEAISAQLTALRRDMPEWINRTAVAATVFFLCFGCSQLALLLHGGRLLRRRPDAGSVGLTAIRS